MPFLRRWIRSHEERIWHLYAGTEASHDVTLCGIRYSVPPPFPQMQDDAPPDGDPRCATCVEAARARATGRRVSA